MNINPSRSHSANTSIYSFLFNAWQTAHSPSPSPNSPPMHNASLFVQATPFLSSSLFLFLSLPFVHDSTCPFLRLTIARVGGESSPSIIYVHPDGQRQPILFIGAVTGGPINARPEHCPLRGRASRRTLSLCTAFSSDPRVRANVWARLILNRLSLITSPTPWHTMQRYLSTAECNNHCHRDTMRRGILSTRVLRINLSFFRQFAESANRSIKRYGFPMDRGLVIRQTIR